MGLSTSIGAIEFRLTSAPPEHALPALEGRPFALLDDGTEVQLLQAGAERYLLVDHRRDPERSFRVEFWECTATPELRLAGLWAVCDAVPSQQR